MWVPQAVGRHKLGYKKYKRSDKKGRGRKKIGKIRVRQTDNF